MTDPNRQANGPRRLSRPPPAEASFSFGCRCGCCGLGSDGPTLCIHGLQHPIDTKPTSASKRERRFCGAEASRASWTIRLPIGRPFGVVPGSSLDLTATVVLSEPVITSILSSCFSSPRPIIVCDIALPFGHTAIASDQAVDTTFVDLQTPGGCLRGRKLVYQPLIIFASVRVPYKQGSRSMWLSDKTKGDNNFSQIGNKATASAGSLKPLNHFS